MFDPQSTLEDQEVAYPVHALGELWFTADLCAS